MSDEAQIMARIEAALERIRAVAGSGQVSEARARQAAAEEALSQLRRQRDRDVAEIETLVSQLKPLLGDA